MILQFVRAGIEVIGYRKEGGLGSCGEESLRDHSKAPVAAQLDYPMDPSPQGRCLPRIYCCLTRGPKTASQSSVMTAANSSARCQSPVRSDKSMHGSRISPTITSSFQGRDGLLELPNVCLIGCGVEWQLLITITLRDRL